MKSLSIFAAAALFALGLPHATLGAEAENLPMPESGAPSQEMREAERQFEKGAADFSREEPQNHKKAQRTGQANWSDIQEGGSSATRHSGAPQREDPRASALHGSPETGYAGTWTDPATGDIITSVIAPTPPQNQSQNYPIIIEPQVSGSGWGSSWNSGWQSGWPQWGDYVGEPGYGTTPPPPPPGPTPPGYPGGPVRPGFNPPNGIGPNIPPFIPPTNMAPNFPPPHHPGYRPLRPNRPPFGFQPNPGPNPPNQGLNPPPPPNMGLNPPKPGFNPNPGMNRPNGAFPPSRPNNPGLWRPGMNPGTPPQAFNPHPGFMPGNPPGWRPLPLRPGGINSPMGGPMGGPRPGGFGGPMGGPRPGGF